MSEQHQQPDVVALGEEHASKAGSLMSEQLEGVIISTRVVASNQKSLFQAFADPQQLAQWWGPKGFTNTIHEFDFRVGGRWQFTMHGPDGNNYPLTKEFMEIVPNERIILKQCGGMHEFVMRMTFETDPCGTRIVWRMAFEPAAEGEGVRAFIVQANEENFDRLVAFLNRAS